MDVPRPGALAPAVPMDEARISSREFRAVNGPALFASGLVTRLQGAPKLAREPTHPPEGLGP